MTNAQPEPSMEEILASIRRIISEDEEEQPSVDRSSLDEPAPRGPELVINSEPETPVQSEQDVALTKMLDIAEARRSGVHHDEDAITEPSDAFQSEDQLADAGQDTSDIAETDLNTEPADDDQARRELTTKDVKMVKQQAAVLETEDSIVDSTTATATAAAFGSLSRSVRVADDEGQTLEHVVTEMLRPMVKEWLDNNLSRIVEEKVEYEVQRLARR